MTENILHAIDEFIPVRSQSGTRDRQIEHGNTSQRVDHSFMLKHSLENIATIHIVQVLMFCRGTVLQPWFLLSFFNSCVVLDLLMYIELLSDLMCVDTVIWGLRRSVCNVYLH